MSLQGSQMACEMLGPDTELSPDSEFWSSEQIWTSPIVEANLFLPNTRLQTHTSWLTLLLQGRLRLPAFGELRFPADGQTTYCKYFLRDCFPGAGAEVRDPNS